MFDDEENDEMMFRYRKQIIEDMMMDLVRDVKLKKDKDEDMGDEDDEDDEL